MKITYNGEYNDGKKVGIWIEMDIGGNKKRKEISYNNWIIIVLKVFKVYYINFDVINKMLKFI